MKDANNVEFVTTKVPPDGGYGWVVASAMALNSFIYIPLSSCFGLIFKDTFAELGLSAAEVSLIVNLHTAFGMLTGLLNGVLLKLFGYRKTAVLAAVLYFGGITSTSFARSFPFFIVAYGLVASLGLGMCKSSFSLALNTYFKKRRSKAIGFTVTVTGFGPIVLPQLITFLMKFYDPQGVMLIFGGLCAHFFVTALLLQPVKWHMKDENEQLTLEQKKSSQPDSVQDSCDACTDNASQESKSLLAKITNFFDLDLLQDGIFLNILLGLSLSLFVDMNFTLLTPFILNDLGLTTYQIATFISTLGAADIVFRFLAPYIGDYLKSTPRQIYVFTIIFTAVMRFGLLFSTDFKVLLIPAIGLGIAKGVRRVYMKLIVPNHVSLEKLPSASGMELMINGLCILVGGSILGIVRDITGSYFHCIIIMNFVSFITVCTWTLEGVMVKYMKKKTAKTSSIKESFVLNKI